jgi:hypothetical protein
MELVLILQILGKITRGGFILLGGTLRLGSQNEVKRSRGRVVLDVSHCFLLQLLIKSKKGQFLRSLCHVSTTFGVADDLQGSEKSVPTIWGILVHPDVLGRI